MQHNDRIKLTGAAIMVSGCNEFLQAASAAFYCRNAAADRTIESLLWAAIESTTE